MDFTLDTGATAWILTSASLVLLMTPGLALFYGGMVRARTVLNMMLMSFSAIAVVAIAWTVAGYSIAFGSDIGGVFGNPLEHLGLTGTDEQSLLGGSGVPFLVAAGFQMTFAVISTALISGAIADRVKLGTWLVFAAVWVLVVYAPLAHMVWGGGLLSGDGPFAAIAEPVDFAGGTVVHINAGIAGLVLAVVVGARKGFGKEPMKPHNLPLVMLGAALLWFGWFGFNGGAAGVACALAVGLKYRFGIDDSLDVVGVHLVGGLVGTIGIGVLAAEGGLLFGGGLNLLLVQILVAVAAMVFSGVLTAVIALVLKVTMGWRIPEADERAGIDITHHAEAGYDLAGALASRRDRAIHPTVHPSPPAGAPEEPRNPVPTDTASAGADAPSPVTSGETR